MSRSADADAPIPFHSIQDASQQNLGNKSILHELGLASHCLGSKERNPNSIQKKFVPVWKMLMRLDESEGGLMCLTSAIMSDWIEWFYVCFLPRDRSGMDPIGTHTTPPPASHFQFNPSTYLLTFIKFSAIFHFPLYYGTAYLKGFGTLDSPYCA